MRWTVQHIQLKEMYEKWDRKWFATYSYYNLCDKGGGLARFDRNSNAKHEIADLLKNGYLIRESGIKMEYTSDWSNYPKINLKERWRLSGKAIYELRYVIENSGIELIDQDYADMAKAELIR